jgi:uncharacterized protein YecE (DUF72 family)
MARALIHLKKEVPAAGTNCTGASRGSNPKPMDIRLGTCGWSFADWVGPFYPRGTKDQLSHYARHFDAVEVDSTWYRVPSERTVRSWHARTPEGFVFCPKLPGEITHENLLRDSDNLARGFLDRICLLEDKLGPVVVQLAPKFTSSDLPTLEAFLRSLPTEFRFAVEFRHRSWLRARDVLALLSSLSMAAVMADHPWYPRLDEVTTDIAYIRLLGKRNVFPDFSRIHRERDDALSQWAQLLRALRPVPGTAFAFINNQFEGHSPESVRRLRHLLEQPT